MWRMHWSFSLPTQRTWKSFRKSQKIDREYWNQRTTGPYTYGREVPKKNRWEPRRVEQNRWEPRNYGPKSIKRDREGDVIMTGAKVSSEEARRKGLCYNCGRKGHLAKDCRQKKQKGSETTDRQTRNPNVAIRMIRFNPGQVSDKDSKEERTKKQRMKESRWMYHQCFIIWV